MTHIAESGFDFDPRLAHRYMRQVKDAVYFGIWNSFRCEWFNFSYSGSFKDTVLIEFSEKKLHKPHNDCLGEEIRFNSDRVVGSCLNYKEKLLHFSGFLKDDMNVPLFKSKVA